MRTSQMAQTCIALDQSSGFLNLCEVQKVFLSNGIRATEEAVAWLCGKASVQ